MSHKGQSRLMARMRQVDVQEHLAPHPSKERTRDDVELHEVVESALESDDMVSLIRLVFEGRTGVTDAHGLGGQRALEKVLAACKAVAEDKEEFIAEACRSGAEEISATAVDLEVMREAAETLQADILGYNAEFQACSKGLLLRLKELEELSTMQGNTHAAVSALSRALQLLREAATAAQCMADGRAYEALHILQRLSAFLHASSSCQAAPGGSGGSGGSGGGGGGGGGSRLGGLHDFLRWRVDMLTEAIQEQALRDFTEWLVSARAQAKELGKEALQRAATARLRTKELAQQRRQVYHHLMQHRNLDSAVQLLVSLTRESRKDPRGEAMRKPPSPTPAAAAELQHQPSLLKAHTLQMSITSLALADIDEEEKKVEVKEKPPEKAAVLDLKLLHRCVELHRRLGRLEWLRGHYYQNRRLQMASDLSVSSNWLEVYQDWVLQMVGFFLIEHRVSLLARNLSDAQSLELLWSSAMGSMKSVLHSAFDGLDTAAQLLAVKDFVHLACSALQSHGFKIEPIQEILIGSSSAYHELLMHTASGQWRDAIAQDRFQPVVLESEAHYQQMLLKGLPAAAAASAAAADAPPQRYPHACPFTSMVPAIINVAQGFIADSVSYFEGLLPLPELLPMARQRRDPALFKALADVLSQHLVSLMAGDPPELEKAFRILSNVAVLECALPALEEFTVNAARGGGCLPTAEKPQHSGQGHSRSTSKDPASGPGPSDAACARPALLVSAVAEVRTATEQVLAQGLRGSLLRQASQYLPLSQDTPPEPLTSQSGRAILQLLQRALQAIDTLVKDAPARTRMTAATLDALGEALLLLLTGTLREQSPASRSGVNTWGLLQYQTDALACSSLAQQHSDVPLPPSLMEAQELCDVVLAGDFSELLDAATRARRHPHVQPRRLHQLLSRYVELPAASSKRVPGIQIPRKRDVEAFLHQLARQEGIS